MNRILFRRVEEIRDTLVDARKTATDPEMIEALTKGIDDLNGFLLDLNSDGTEEPDETKPLVKPEPFDINAEIRRLFLSPAHMGVVAG